MDEKIFCIKCNLRIWRYSDSKRYVDQYFQDSHINCEKALGKKVPLNSRWQPDHSFTEYRPMEKEGSGKQEAV